MFPKPIPRPINATYDSGLTPGHVRELKDTLLAERKSTLLPTPARVPRGPLDTRLAALQSLRGTEADTLKNDVLKGKDLPTVWLDAAMHGKVDVMRAILLLVDEKQLKSELSGTLTGSVLQIGLQAIGDPALRSVVKENPYFSGKFRMDSPEGNGDLKKLNGKANFATPAKGPSAPPDAIACRHLAMHFVEKSVESDTAKFDFTAFDSIANIQESVKPDTEKKFKALCDTAMDTHLVDTKEFGNFLVSQFGEMQHTGKDTKVAIIITDNHAMAFSLRIKVKDGRTQYVVRFYDPNNTNGHARSSASMPEAYSSNTVDSYIDNKDLHKAYFPKGDFVAGIFFHDKSSNLTDGERIERPRELTSVRCDINETMVRTMLEFGFDKSLRDLKPALAAMPEAKCLELLSCLHATVAIPGFAHAIRCNNPRIVDAFSDLLQTVPQDKHYELLEAKVNGRPVLYGAVVRNQPEMISAFSSAIKRLPVDRQSEFLEARDKGQTALATALAKGNDGVISSYADLILSVKRDNINDALPLLEARDGNGLPRLHVCARHRSDEAKGATEKYAVVVSSVAPELRAALCSVPNGAGESPLCSAMLNGNAHAVRGFKALLELVPPKDRMALLETKTSSGRPAVQTALESGETDAIEAYAELLELITPNERIALAEKNAVGEEATLKGAVGADHPAAYVAYMLMMMR